MDNKLQILLKKVTPFLAVPVGCQESLGERWGHVSPSPFHSVYEPSVMGVPCSDTVSHEHTPPQPMALALSAHFLP